MLEILGIGPLGVSHDDPLPVPGKGFGRGFGESESGFDMRLLVGFRFYQGKIRRTGCSGLRGEKPQPITWEEKRVIPLKTYISW